MDPLLAQFLQAIIRWALTLIAGRLALDDKWIAGAALGLTTLAWSLWQKYRAHLTIQEVAKAIGRLSMALRASHAREVVLEKKEGDKCP